MEGTPAQACTAARGPMAQGAPEKPCSGGPRVVSFLVSGWMEKPATWLSHSQRGDSLSRDPAAGLSPGRFSAAAASLFPGGREAAGALEPVGWLCPARGGQSGPTQLTPPSPQRRGCSGSQPVAWPWSPAR